ncbi:hypothetical protein VaNZ11_010106 [Volvox africanus]|uniref:Uncharacterized protein n=1 Tax=Volvox africanus TaxID=51714 RepID=A0ABQ5S8T1_9CHLO|nr:hypothetical protein VaNZ11_010106 [Volvox africanus]
MAYDVQNGDADFDVSPLQKAFLTLANKVDQCQKENAALRAELTELRVAKRLEALEQGLQELADTSSPAGLFWSQSTNGREEFRAGPRDFATSASGRFAVASMSGARQGGPSVEGGPTSTSGTAAGGAGVPPVGMEASWLVQEVMALRERLGAMERKSEALWHAQEDDEQIRATVERLRQDVVNMQAGVAEAQGAAASANNLAERQAAATTESVVYVKDLQERMHMLEMGSMKAAEERRELASKYESSVGQIWDQLRHVEGSLAQRLTLAETSHVAALQEVDEAKEATNEVLQRVDDVKRHVSALEGKLESFNTQVAAAINPLHNALAAATERLESLATAKQDAATAIKQADVELGVARAIEYTDRRGDNLLKAIAGLEARLEALADSTPNKGEVVLTSDLEALLTEHAHELDLHLEGLKAEMLAGIAAKVDRDELAGIDGRLCGRLEGLEGALLKGLRAISDKVSAALGEKLDLLKFNEFKLQVRAILADVEDRLRDWSPLAFGTKAQLGTDPMTAGAAGAPSCLCCDSRVRSVRDLRAMGFKEDDRVFSPDKLPLTDPLLPSIQGNRAVNLGAHINARLSNRVATADARLRTTNSLMEILPSGPVGGSGGGGGGGSSPGTAPGAGSSAGGLAAAVDAGNFATLPPQQTREDKLASAGAGRVASARGIKVKVETVSGSIMKGQLPLRQGTASGGGGGVMPGSLAVAAGIAPPRAPRTPVAAASTATGLPQHIGVTGSAGAMAAAAAAGAAAVAAAVHGHDLGAFRPMSPWRADMPGADMETGPMVLGGGAGA